MPVIEEQEEKPDPPYITKVSTSGTFEIKFSELRFSDSIRSLKDTSLETLNQTSVVSYNDNDFIRGLESSIEAHRGLEVYLEPSEMSERATLSFNYTVTDFTETAISFYL